MEYIPVVAGRNRECLGDVILLEHFSRIRSRIRERGEDRLVESGWNRICGGEVSLCRMRMARGSLD